MPKDETRCVANVPDDTNWHFYQCSRKRGHGPEGKYCWQHAKKFEPRKVPEVPIRTILKLELQPFVESMLDELERHYAEKGTSWKQCSIAYLLDRCAVQFEDMMNDPDRENYMANIANYAYMLWWHETTAKYTEKRS